ncbi:MAG TPA: amidohydrolase family protein [Mycobacteriales bacterium]|nr:amidohydrolase family protein [Mycobacteriales bacterium]
MTAAALHVRAVLLPGEEERDLWVRDGALTFEPVPGARTVARGGYALPGLVDAHCHVGLTPSGPALGDEPLAQAHTDRDTGALLLRDCGSPVDTRFLLDRADAPRLIRAGRHLARPKRYVRGLALEVEPDELPDAVAEQARYGGGWVKLVGDWIDRSVGDLTPLWPAGVLAEAVGRAHAAGARVAVHTFGEEALADLVAAGVDSIEHGTGLTDDLVGAVAGPGIALVPTLINTAENFLGIAERADKYPSYAARMRRLHRTAAGRVRAAHEAGVPIYVGTDAGGTMPHGQVAAEIRALHAAGLPAAAALAAGSWAARDWLGLPGLVEGAPADLVVYDRDPRTDLSVLHTPARIILRGRVVDPFVG